MTPQDRLVRVWAALQDALPKLDRRTKAGKRIAFARVELRLAMIDLGVRVLPEVERGT